MYNNKVIYVNDSQQLQYIWFTWELIPNKRLMDFEN